MLELYEPFSETLALEAEMWYSDKTNALIGDMEEIIINLEEEILKEKATLLLSEINEKERIKSKEDLNSDILNYQKIVEKIENIKSRRSK